MPSVEAAIGRFYAVKAVLAPSLLPIPVVPVIYEGEIIINLHIEGQPKLFMSIYDPVFPYVTDASADVEVTVAYDLEGGYLRVRKLGRDATTGTPIVWN